MTDYSNYLIVSDLDGTLINSSHYIPEKNLDAIKYFIERGGRFSIASGRTIQNIRPFIKNLELNGPCILYNGAGVYDFKHEKLLQAEFLEKFNFKDYISYCMENYPNMVVQIFTPESMYITTPEENVDPYVERENQEFIRASLDEVIQHEWFKVMMYDSHETLLKAQAALKLFGMEDKVDSVFSLEFYLELLSKNVSKGWALNSIRHLEHFKDKYIIAVGDYDNDIEMIKLADLGLAVENASERVKKAADMKTVSNDEGVLADIIYNIIPNR